jgi:hypothetical protein
MMRGAGVSPRPVVFIAALVLPLAAVFAVAQLVRARAPAPPQPRAALAVRDGRFVEREKLFGPGVPGELIREAKSGMPGILNEAEAAEAGVTTSGETVLVAQFPTEAQARSASAAWWQAFQLRNTSGDEERGWRGTRMQGDFVEMLQTGRQLFVWTGLTKEAAASRRAASALGGLLPAAKPREPLFPSLQRLAEIFEPLPVKLGGTTAMVLLYTILFVKGASWAGSASPGAGSRPVAAAELASRLLALNDTDIPFTVSKGESDAEFIADWRFADAKWMDLARVHGLRRTSRIKLTLDESSHVVRATDFSASVDWSAGPAAASLAWKAETGIIFFQKERGRVFGLQLDDQGRLKPDLKYDWKFDLSEMKSPLMSAVTTSGWTWRPAVWRGPSWLRWLSE